MLQKAAPGQNTSATFVNICNHLSGVLVRWLEHTNSATTCQVFWFGAWKHPICNHQWEVTPLLVLWFGAGVPPCASGGCQVVTLRHSDKKAGGQVSTVGVPHRRRFWLSR